jgi:hypothetical protein
VNHTSDTTTTTCDNGGNFDPQQAAALLDQATQQARADWRPSGSALAVAVVGAVAVSAGPAGAWAVAGVGLCVILLGSAAAIAWRQRA